MDVDSVVSSEKLWYDWRCVYSVSHDELGRRHLSFVRNLSPQKMAEYKKAALLCVKSPKGPCSYTGYVYTSTLHMPFRPWRRVVYDEIQDLASGGDESGKNLLQLSRTAKNVWLVSATPFPHGNRSVYANHELLGFCRLRMELEKDARGDPIAELPRNHPFEVIKRKLYIRSPRHIADEAVTASRKTTRSTVYVDATPLERKFFELESADIGSSPSIFRDENASLRQMMIHPEACKKLREDADGGSKSVGRFATVNSFAKRSLATAKERLRELDRTLLPNAQRDIDLIKSSWHLAIKIRQVRESAPVQANPFARREESSTPAVFCLETEEDNAICAYFKTDESTLFQTIGRGQDAPAVEISGHKAMSRVIDYFRNEAKPGRKIPYNANGGEEHECLEVFIRRKETFYHTCVTKKNSLLVERSNLVTRIMALEETVKVGGNITRGMTEDEELVARNGSKTAALIRHLREIRCMGEKTIVFSYWHDVLSLVHRSLRTNGLDVAFCNGRTGNMMTKAIQEFTSGEASILLLSAEVKASGANLQVATNVVLLDPAGDSAEHGANLETQAIGRAVRMGQENAVRVVRFCVRDTVEEELFRRIDVAAANSAIRNNDDAYVCESAHTSLDEKVLEKRMEDDDVDDEVFVGESVSVGERVARAKARAIEKNEIIVIDDSDDEDTKPPSNVAKSVGDITSKGNKMAEPSAKFATAKRSNGSVAAVTDNAELHKRARVTPEMLPPVTDTSNARKREPCALAKEGSGGDNTHSAYRPPGATSLLCVVDSPTVASSDAKASNDFISDDTELSKIVTYYCAVE